MNLYNKKCMKFHYRLPISITLLTLLSACGGGDDDNNKSTKPSKPDLTQSLIAMDGYASVKPNNPTRVDLSPFISSDAVQISSVRSLSNDDKCKQATANGTGINVTIPNGSYCEYAYTAEHVNMPQAVAKLNVLATNANNPILPPISKALVLGSNPVFFDLPTLLGSDWKNTYSLNIDSVQVQGMEGNLGTETATGNTISFSPPELSGWNRIVYTVNDSATPESNRMGVIYVTISDKVNQPPTIGLLKYDYDKNNTNNPIIANTDTPLRPATILNLENLPNLNIKDNDGHEWQLINVQSFTASVSPENANSVTNKSFTFTTPVVGDHIVSYIIADHFGGYSHGLIKIHVAANEKTASWKNITSTGNTFVAPLLYSQAQIKGLNVSPQWDDGVKNTIAGFQQNAADILCSTIGALPTISSINLLYQDSLVKNELSQWPKQKRFLAQNKGTVVGYDMSTGTEYPYDSSQPYYVTCIENRNFSLKMLTNTVVANNTRIPVIKVTIPSEDTKLTLSKIAGTLTDEQVDLLQDNIDSATIDLTTQATTAGTYRLRITNADDTVSSLTSSIITYIGDKDTGKFAPNTGLVITKNNATPDGVDTDSLTATLTDAYNNPVSGEKINIVLEEPAETNNSSAKFSTIPSNAITDSEGKVVINVSNTEGEPIKVITTYTASVSGESSAEKTVNFVGLASDGYPCSNGGFECIPVSEGSGNFTGYLLASSPSQQAASFLGMVQGVDYHKDVQNGQYQVPGLNVIGLTTAQAIEYCKKLNTVKLSNRTNWELPIETDTQASAFITDEISNKKPYMSKGWPWQYPSTLSFESDSHAYEIPSPWETGSFDGTFSSWGMVLSGRPSETYSPLISTRDDVAVGIGNRIGISSAVSTTSICVSKP
ncbi:TPA: Ig-like domain-containing protein [Photobacterium damselae]